MRSVVIGVVGLMVTLCGRSQEIGYVETFSLAGDRATALNELVPGTDDYYYYHALHAQNSGAGPRFKEMLDRWIRERNGNVTVTARELLNRQALLDYVKDPQRSLDYLRHELSLYFNHTRKTGVRVSQAPSVLDNTRISTPTLLKQALTENSSLDHVEDVGLILAAGQQINDEQRRNLVSRLRRPDYPGLVDLIIADLKYRDSRGFGSHPIHALLTLAQMDELLQKQPGLRNEVAFVNAYLSKLAPENEVDLETSAFAREAYFDRVWAFVKTLDPVHNSLKANVLYNRLRRNMMRSGG